MTEALFLAIKVSVSALILATGMGARFSDIIFLWHRPKLLLRSLLAMYVLVPLAALLVVKIMSLPAGTKAALLVLAASSGAPLLPRRLQQFGSNIYTFSLLITSSLLAIVVVPVWLTFLSRYFDISVEFSIIDVMAVMAKAFLLPLAIGMSFGALFPAANLRIADKLWAVAAIVFIIACLALLAMNWQVLLEVRGHGMVALVILMIVATTIGHILGGPDPDNRTALAVACCTRHLGVAVIVASAFRGPRAVVLLVAYIFCSSLVSMPYLRWRRHKMHAQIPSPINRQAQPPLLTFSRHYMVALQNFGRSTLEQLFARPSNQEKTGGDLATVTPSRMKSIATLVLYRRDWSLLPA